MATVTVSLLPRAAGGKTEVVHHQSRNHYQNRKMVSIVAVEDTEKTKQDHQPR